MSRFFRSPDSSSSSSEGDDQEDNLEPGDDEAEQLLQPIATVEPSIVNRPSADRNNHHRDFMLHALLEERCMNEVLALHRFTAWSLTRVDYVLTYVEPCVGTCIVSE